MYGWFTRDWAIVWGVDTIAGTGSRLHEVFAVLLDEIVLDVADPYLDVTGMLIECKTAPGGWVRGSEFDRVIPRTFRFAVATAVDHATGDPDRAARQLGNTREIAKKRYIDAPDTARDNRAVILESWTHSASSKV